MKSSAINKNHVHGNRYNLLFSGYLEANIYPVLFGFVSSYKIPVILLC